MLGPHNKDYRILRSILISRYFGKLPNSSRGHSKSHSSNTDNYRGICADHIMQ